MVIEILGRIITKKNNKTIRKNFSTGGRFVGSSDQWLIFEQEALIQLMRQKRKIGYFVGKEKLRVSYTFMMKGRLDADTDNMMASCNDLLQKAGIIEDDKMIVAGEFCKLHGYKEFKTYLDIREI